MEYNWVFCAGNRRSGSTVHYHYVRELIEHAGVGRGYGAVPRGAIGPQPWSILDYQSEKHVKVFRTHRPTNAIKQIRIENPKTKIVYIHRDMRDVLVSTMHHEPHMKFHWFVNDWVQNNIKSEHYWLGQSGTLVTKYENMIGDPLGEIQRLVSYLELEVSEEFQYNLCRKYDIGRVKAITQAADTTNPLYGVRTLMGSGWAVSEGGFRAFLRNHVHDGSWGQFMTALTEQEIYTIERECAENLVHRGYPLYDELKTYWKQKEH